MVINNNKLDFIKFNGSIFIVLLDNQQFNSLNVFVCLMVFNTTFNNISVISWWSVLLVEETVGPRENHQPVQVTDKLYHIKLYTSH